MYCQDGECRWISRSSAQQESVRLSVYRWIASDVEIGLVKLSPNPTIPSFTRASGNNGGVSSERLPFLPIEDVRRFDSLNPSDAGRLADIGGEFWGRESARRM